MSEPLGRVNSRPGVTESRDSRSNDRVLTLVVVAVFGFIALIAVLAAAQSMPSAEVKMYRAKWEKAQITHYKIVVFYDGYGTYELMPVTLEVRDDQIVSMIDTHGKVVEHFSEPPRLTVNGLFDEVEQAYQTGAPEVRVTYDPTYGYPVDIDIDPYREPCCQQYSFKVQDFEVLPK